MSLKSKALKLAPLLAQYLYSHKRLDLEGIGSFFLDPSVVIETDNPRQPRQTSPEGISFENNPSIRESPELISFISAQTGKMKALASADLNSHLELAQQFLNIGKPFQLEGIGNLIKVRSGVYEFKADALLTEKFREVSGKELSHPDGEGDYQPFLEKEKTKTAWKKPVLALLIIFGIGLAILGGYTIYKRNNPVTNNESSEKQQEAPSLVAGDTSNAAKSASTTMVITPPTNNGSYKFVLETAGRNRAFERYNKLKKYNWNVKMETQDSAHYKLFLLLPSLAIDTSRLVDSLTALNGRRVYVEN